jgi:multidrug/hemolysin transport system ATP-binding protein
MDIILKANHLSKNYGHIEAVKDVSFFVKRGSLFAFLGPNGAGKSTTIKMLTTLLKPDQGEIQLNDQHNQNYIRNKIGVVFQENVLDDLLSVKENLLLRGALYIKNKKDLMLRYQQLSEDLELKSIENQKFKTLSGGQKRRCEIARSLFSNPEILLLDEPTTGLDPESRQKVWSLIEKLKQKENLTIFLTTHYMEEAKDANHVVVIDKGEIKVQGTPSELKSNYSDDVLKVVPKNKELFEKTLNEINKTYQKISDQFIIVIRDTEDALQTINIIKDNIKQFEMVKGTLDDVFINVINGGKQNV